MDAFPSFDPDAPERSCPACSSTSLTDGRLSTERESIELYACDDCGDFWFERLGTRLTAAAMRDLGLIP